MISLKMGKKGRYNPHFQNSKSVENFFQGNLYSLKIMKSWIISTLFAQNTYYFGCLNYLKRLYLHILWNH